MKILFVTPFIIHRNIPHAGGQEIFQIVNRLNQKHDVYLISLCSRDDVQYVGESRFCCRSLDVVYSNRYFIERLKSGIKMLVTNPAMIGKRASTHVSNKIEALVLREKIDILQVEYTDFAEALSLPRDIPSIVVAIDIRIKLAERILKQCRYTWKRKELSRKLLRTIRGEIATCKKYSCVVTRSDYDKAVLSRYGTFHIEVVPHGITPSDESKHLLGDREKGSVVFLGAMNRRENVEAVLYFYKKVFPLIKAKIPEVKFYIVGNSPPKEIGRLAVDKNTIVTGYVDDPREYLHMCAVMVAPVLVGGGIITKIIEGMAAGCSVVTTSYGNEGVQAVPGKEILVGDSAEMFAGNVTKLLTDEEYRVRVAEAGFKRVNEQYSWENVITRMESVYHQLIVESSKQSTNTMLMNV